MATSPTVQLEAVTNAEGVLHVVDQICRIHGQALARCNREPVSAGNFPERRNGHRQAMDIPFHLFPALRFGNRLEITSREPVPAITRDLSRNGIGFQYDAPVEGRYVVAEFDSMTAEPFRLVIDVRWRQKRTKHLYAAGGQIVGLLKSPASEH